MYKFFNRWLKNEYDYSDLKIKSRKQNSFLKFNFSSAPCIFGTVNKQNEQKTKTKKKKKMHKKGQTQLINKNLNETKNFYNR